MDPSSVLTRVEGLMSSQVGSDIVFLNPRTDSYVALDEVGRAVWEALEEPRSLADLVGELTTRYAGDAQQIEADVRAFVARLEAEGMVQVSDPRGD